MDEDGNSSLDDCIIGEVEEDGENSLDETLERYHEFSLGFLCVLDKIFFDIQVIISSLLLMLKLDKRAYKFSLNG